MNLVSCDTTGALGANGTFVSENILVNNIKQLGNQTLFMFFFCNLDAINLVKSSIIVKYLESFSLFKMNATNVNVAESF